MLSVKQSVKVTGT